MSNIIAVIGATGAQGLPVVKHLLAPSSDGSPSPWKVRALTRNPNHDRAKELQELGAEIVQGLFKPNSGRLFISLMHDSKSPLLGLGSFLEAADIHKLFKGAHGAFVNTDSFTVGAAVEMHSAFTIVCHHTL